MSRLIWITGILVLCGALAAPVMAQSAQADSRFVAEVIANKLTVRSGPSLNYYAVTSLNAGDRVTVTGEDHGWYSIVPPPGTYSLVSKDYVDIDVDGRSGVVNGNALRVRAGSDLDRSRYAVQLKLDKGAQVQVLGETDDGYLKIAPPPGAFLWVSADYVARVPDERISLERQTNLASPPVGEQVSSEPRAVLPQEAPAANTENAAPETVDDMPDVAQGETVAPTAETGTVDARAVAQPLDEAVTEAAAPPSEYRQKLEAIEADLKAELDKPAPQRVLKPLLDRYQEIADEEKADRVTRLYAERRITQIRTALDAREAIASMRELAGQITEVRKEALAGRTRIRPITRDMPKGFDAKGELRESMVYSSPTGQRRYRLVDPDLDVPRTLCYVEIPRDSSIDIANYLGRLVGIRAREQYLQTGDVNPITIIVAEDIVPLKSMTEQTGDESGEKDQAVAIVVPDDAPPVDTHPERD